MLIKTILYMSILACFFLISVIFPLNIAGYTVFTLACAYFMEYFGVFKTLAIYLIPTTCELLLSLQGLYAEIHDLGQILTNMIKLPILQNPNSTLIPNPVITNAPPPHSLIFFFSNTWLVLGLLIAMAYPLLVGELMLLHRVLHKKGAYRRFPL
jgi:hypothetical protein